VLTCKDKHLLKFASRHGLSLDWLFEGDLRGLWLMRRGLI
jgi:hypothetical protein